LGSICSVTRCATFLIPDCERDSATREGINRNALV
jgi:hypothetical protein